MSDLWVLTEGERRIWNAALRDGLSPRAALALIELERTTEWDDGPST